MDWQDHMGIIFFLFLFLSTQLPFDEALASDLVVAIDVGHTSAVYGARSARGRGEYQFNLDVGAQVKKALARHGYERAFMIVNPKRLADRSRIAREKNADVLISFHHDSAQSHFLEEWTYNGKKERFCDRFRGFSLLVSTRNAKFRDSLRLATVIGRNLKRQGFAPTLHHAEDVPGEKHFLFNPELGIYRYDNLMVLRTANMPAVLVEVGVIINRDEERILLREETREKVARAIVNSVMEYQLIMGDRTRMLKRG